MDRVSGGVGENERGDYVAYVRTAESEKEAAVRLSLLSVRSGLQEWEASLKRAPPSQSDPVNVCLSQTWLQNWPQYWVRPKLAGNHRVSPDVMFR